MLELALGDNPLTSIWWTNTAEVGAGRSSTSISHNVDFCWDPIPSRPRGSNLYQSVADVFRDWYLYPVLAGEVQRRSWMQVILIQHLWDTSFQIQPPGPIPALPFTQPYPEPPVLHISPSPSCHTARDCRSLCPLERQEPFLLMAGPCALSHLVASDCRFISERNHRVPLKAETGA